MLKEGGCPDVREETRRSAGYEGGGGGKREGCKLSLLRKNEEKGSAFFLRRPVSRMRKRRGKEVPFTEEKKVPRTRRKRGKEEALIFLRGRPASASCLAKKMCAAEGGGRKVFHLNHPRKRGERSKPIRHNGQPGRVRRASRGGKNTAQVPLTRRRGGKSNSPSSLQDKGRGKGVERGNRGGGGSSYEGNEKRL